MISSALVKCSRMEAHTSLWCEANDDAEFVEDREREQSLKGLREEIAAQLLELTQ